MQEKKKRKPKKGDPDKSADFVPEDLSGTVPDSGELNTKLDGLIEKAKVKEKKLKAEKKRRREGCCM